MGKFMHRYLLIVIFMLTLIVLSGCFSEGVHDYPDALAELNPSVGYISGKVLNAYTGIAAQGVSVTVYDEWGKVNKSTTTDMEGNYKLPLLTGYGYFVEFSRYAFIMDLYYGIDIQKGRTTYLNDIKLVPQKYSGTGSLIGTIMDEDQVTAVSGARILLFRGAGSRIPESHLQGQSWSSSDGSFSFADLASRNYTLEISHVGYDTLFRTFPCLSGITSENLNIVMHREKIEGTVRISLKWGDRVHDLDSHLTGPLYSPQLAGSRFHVFYKNMRVWEDGFESFLDEDAKDSGITETITVNPVKSGDYIYYVHNYKNADLPHPVALKNSEAMVTLYYNGKKRDFSPPLKDGNLWAVFRISDGILTVLDEVVDQSSPDYIEQHDKQFLP